MPIRPSNIGHSHSANGKSISNFIPQTYSPYLLSEEGSTGDDSDFSFEIEEETVQSPKKNSIATKKQTINEDVSVRSPNSRDSSQPKSSHTVLSRDEAQRSLKSKVEEKPSRVTTSSSNKAVTYTALSAQKKDHDDMSFEESILSDDDFSISVASETDVLVSGVKSSSSNVKKRAVEVKQPVGSRRSVEQSRLDRRGYASEDASTTSSKTAIQSLMEKLSSMGDTSNSRTTPSRPSFDTAKQTPVEKKQPLQTDATSTTSSKVQSLKSKAAGSIDFAESIVKSHGDIESGASTAVSTSCSSGRLGKRLWWSYGDGTMEGQKVTTTPSSKRSSRCKLCCIVGFVLVAAAGTVGALIALDVILKEKLSPSSETPDTATPTKSDSNSWYVNWDAFQCVMDCNGRPPCGGTKKNDDETFPTLKECCSEGMGNFIDEHWTLDICMEMTDVETVIPTFSPTPEKKEETSAPTAGPQASPPSPPKPSELYYADFSEMKCTAESTSRKARWEKGYETISDCCDANFWGNLYKECLGEADSGTVTITLYYPDYGGRNCVEEYVNTKQIWDKGFDTKDECCEVNFSWDKASICFRGDEIIATTSPTSTMPTSSPIRAPSLHPTLMPTTSSPTQAPSRAPTRAPSRAPTSAPITPGSPTRSPVVSPTASPSTFPSRTPTFVPSISVAPTEKPSLKPSVTPTSPTPSPTGELEILRAVLVKRSPISSDNLLLERSPQYRAMEWLVSNTLYDSYPYDRKIQRWALSTFYYSLYGSEWVVKDGWVNHEGNLENECTWHGISCTASGTVMSIDLKANKVFGHVPNETSLLVDVEYLGLSENEIRSIPSSLIDLPKLKVLDLHKNRLRMIPEGGYGSSLLEELYLSYNGISSIPDGLFQLRFVKVLWLANNEISSTLPNGFGKMTHLEELDLESNQFHGPIPEEMFSLVNLALLYLYDNELTGQFPPGLSQMSSLTELDLHSNNIGGQLPTEIGRFSTLSELYLGNNKISGQIPSQLFQVSSLTVLDISENFLNSTIGSDIGNLNQLTQLHLHDNYNKNEGSFGIYGSIPESIGSLTLLKELRLDNNYVEGMLPPSIGDLQNLEILRLESNNLYGSIKAVANAKKLRYVHLWSNYFSGTISNIIGQLSQVVELFLDDNELTGSIPSEMGLLSNAKYIALGINELEGMIPSSFGMLSSLERLDLQENNLSGEIPADMGNIKSLERMRLEGNQFYGDIPKEVCNLESLEFLSGSCAIAEDTTIENSHWWSCNCCTTCDEP
jgi:Leucine-rich repeat (LRR) protein